ncbi:MAG: S1C family serine protease [Planctomycetota bacterium]
MHKLSFFLELTIAGLLATAGPSLAQGGRAGPGPRGGAPNARHDHVRKCTVQVTTVDRNLLKAQELVRRKASAEELNKLKIVQRVPLRFSGLIISERGEIVTTAVHPRAALRIQVRYADGSTDIAELIGTDPLTNVALLRVPRKTKLFLKLNEKPRSVGDAVHINGQASLSGRFAKGIVSRANLRLPIRDLYGVDGSFNLNGQRFIVLDKVVAITGPVARPLPGGACVDNQGLLIGMVVGTTPPVQKVEQVEGIQMLVTYESTFVVPAARLIEIANELRKNGKVRRSHFGLYVSPVGDALRAHCDLPPAAAAVMGVLRGAPCAKAGLQVNDVLLAVNGKVFEDFDRLAKALSGQKPGAPATLTILRKGKRMDVTVTPSER